SNGLTAGSPEFNKALVETIVSTVVTILLFVIAATNPVGAIIGAIIGVIDGILTLLCDLGNASLRSVPGLGGACFTISTAITKYLAFILYNYDLMIDVGRDDLMVTGVPQITLANPSKGYVAGNALNLTLPVTTTIVHKNPDLANGILI